MIGHTCAVILNIVIAMDQEDNYIFACVVNGVDSLYNCIYNYLYHYICYTYYILHALAMKDVVQVPVT